jgi:hypothetical protein
MFRFRPVLQLTALALIVAASAVAGCSHEIGDECTTAADCNPNGSRSCDQSQPGGYCTVQGCDETSCPSEAVCIRYFPAQYLTKPCDPAILPSQCDPTLMSCCAAAELCLDSGLCAPLSTELRYCVKRCSKDDDCRGGYECRLSGTRGSMSLTSNPKDIIHFCAPMTSG